MNDRQKQVQQRRLENEADVLAELEAVYAQSLDDIEAKLRRLEFEIGELQETYEWLDDDDPEKDIIQSRIQSKIYQKEYQQALQDQLSGILDEMHTQEFLAISDYLDTCYTDGFVGSLFDLHGQGVPLLFPLDQENMVKAIQLDSPISEGLYTRLGHDIKALKDIIAAEVTRAIATGESYDDLRKRLQRRAQITRNQAKRIARTEGGRVQTLGTVDAMEKAKERGADIVKQWDATLDDKTRESHVAVDGEIRELDEPFSNGMMHPFDSKGGAAEVVNCRCALLQRARWAVGGSFTKWDGRTDELRTFQDADDYAEFKRQYFAAIHTDA